MKQIRTRAPDSEFWESIHRAGCAVTELRIRRQSTKQRGRLSSFFFGTYVDLFDVAGTPIVGEAIYCHTSGWETKPPRNSRYRREITTLLDLSDVGAISAVAPKVFVRSKAANEALMFPWWCANGLAARHKARPILLDVLHPVASDAVGAMALAMMFSRRGNPVTALVGLPVPRRRTSMTLGFFDMQLLADALQPFCRGVDVYRYRFGRSRRWNEHMTPHNEKLGSIYKELSK